MRKLTTIAVIAVALVATACGKKADDKLSDADIAASEGTGGKPAAADRRCAQARTSDSVKAQLFTRAAEIRGGFADNYARIAGFALLQLDGAAPVVEVAAAQPIDCRAHAVLRLPPGLHASGGRTQLGGDVDYTVAANGVVSLGAAEALTEPLATLSQSRSAASGPATPPPLGASPPSVAAPPDPLSPRPAPPPRPAPVPRPAAVPAVGRPSFDCARARTASEHAVCGNSGLAALDRAMANRYVGGLANGGPDAARLLRQTRDPFLGYRERCGSDETCIDRVYRGRLREIDDIVAGRWRGDR